LLGKSYCLLLLAQLPSGRLSRIFNKIRIQGFGYYRIIVGLIILGLWAFGVDLKINIGQKISE